MVVVLFEQGRNVLFEWMGVHTFLIAYNVRGFVDDEHCHAIVAVAIVDFRFLLQLSEPMCVVGHYFNGIFGRGGGEVDGAVSMDGWCANNQSQ